MSSPQLKNVEEKIMKKNNKKFFYHDIVSQIHGLRLFIQSKKDHKKNLNSDDLSLIYNELGNLQNITLDFFKENHKNLDENSNFLKSNDIHSYINELKKVYLLDSKLWISEIGRPIDEVYYHRAIFIRVLSNLFKNIQESVKTEAYLTVNYLSSGEIEFSFKNDFYRKNNSSGQVDIREPIGIKSILELSEEQGWKIDSKLEYDQFETSLIVGPIKIDNKAA